MKNKFKKLLSIVLSICLLLSVCTVASVMTVSAAEKITDYYVGYGGTGDGSSLENMAPTILKAIQTINENGLVEGDTATIHVVQDIAGFMKNDGDKKHNLAVWGGNNNTNPAVVGHTAKIVIKPYKDNQKNNPSVGETYIAMGAQYIDQSIIGIGGPTEVQDITLVYCSRSNFSNNKSIIITNGNDLTLNKGVKIGNFAVNGNDTWATYTPKVVYDKTVGGFGSIALDGTTQPFTKPVNMILKNPMSYGNNRINVPAWGEGTYVFNENVNVEVSNSNNGGVYIALGTSKSTSTITYNKNLTFKIDGYVRLRNNDSFSKSIIKGGLHLIIGSSFTYETYPLTNLIDACYKEDGTSTADYWQLNVKTEQMDLINQQGETGKFVLHVNYEATATNKTTGATVDSVDGVLDLSAAPGEYDVALTKVSSKVFDYYVKAGGTGDGTDINDPAPSIAAAVAGVNSLSLTEKDVANIWVMQNDLTTIETNGATSATFTNIPFWGNVPEHKAKIVINAYKDNTYTGDITKTIVSMTNSVGDATGMTFGGPTVLGNIQLLYSTKSHLTNTGVTKINLNGKDVTFLESASAAYINANGANTYPEGHENAGKAYNAAGWPTDVASHLTSFEGMMSTWITRDTGETAVEYNNPINVVINKGMRATNPDQQRFYVADSNSTFNENVTITMDVDEVDNQRFDFGVTYHATFKKNLNLKLISSKNFGYSGSAVVDGGFHFIMSKSAGFHSSYPYADIDNTLTKSSGGAADSWIILVNGEDIDYVDFQGETGKFIAYKPNCTAAAYDADNNLIKEANENNIIDLSATTGEYTIKFTELQQETHVYDQGTNPFINYRGYNTNATKYNGALANTYSKLTTGDKELNVVYFGGSVTAGTGVTDAEKDSWRGRIGSWLVDNFPEATVNNIDKAAGETGTYLGSYRVARDIVSVAPDLLFIEYSINDYYDNRGYGYTGDVAYNRASFQFETIVRAVKEAYPDCDIITVLVTDVDCARTERNGVLHTEAQAHEDIAKEYNISSIHVGRVLAEKVTQEGWVSGRDAIWAKYMRVTSTGYVDMVHPNAAGYDVYFQVIKEFMANTLFFGGYGKIEVQNQELPEMVNPYLFDGEVTYIDENDKTKVTYPEGNITSSLTNQGVAYPDYKGLLFVPAGCQDIITVKFNGTELGVTLKNGNAEKTGNTYKVRIDGGEWNTYNYLGNNPTVIATGLEAGDHVAEIIFSPETAVSGIADYRVSGFFSRNAEKATNRLNICALVALEETLSDSTDDVRDYNNDDVVDIKDFNTLRKMLLNNK